MGIKKITNAIFNSPISTCAYHLGFIYACMHLTDQKSIEVFTLLVSIDILMITLLTHRKHMDKKTAAKRDGVK